MVVEAENSTGTSSNESRPMVAWGDVVYGRGRLQRSGNIRGGLNMWFSFCLLKLNNDVFCDIILNDFILYRVNVVVSAFGNK